MCSTSMSDCRICYDAVCNSVGYRAWKVNCYIINSNVYIIVVVLLVYICVCVCAFVQVGFYCVVYFSIVRVNIYVKEYIFVSCGVVYIMYIEVKLSRYRPKVA
jgi:hypothetical protein